MEATLSARSEIGPMPDTILSNDGIAISMVRFDWFKVESRPSHKSVWEVRDGAVASHGSASRCAWRPSAGRSPPHWDRIQSRFREIPVLARVMRHDRTTNVQCPGPSTRAGSRDEAKTVFYCRDATHRSPLLDCHAWPPRFHLFQSNPG